MDFKKMYEARKGDTTSTGLMTPPPLHEARLDRVMHVLPFLDPVLVLDYGCGFADLYLRLKEACPDTAYVGVDAVQWILEEAHDRYRGAQLLLGDVFNPTILKKMPPADVVCCLGVLATMPEETVPEFLSLLLSKSPKYLLLSFQSRQHGYGGSLAAYTQEELEDLLGPAVGVFPPVTEDTEVLCLFAPHE